MTDQPPPPPSPDPNPNADIDPKQPATTAASRPAPPPEPPAEPFTHAELAACLTGPHHLLDVVLGERRRLLANLTRGVELKAVLAALIACSFGFAIPFALVDGPSRIAHVALLFAGTALLCYPSLQVFTAYLGVRLHPAKNLAVVLVIPSAAALFTFGFAPIYWFLDATMPDPDGMTGTTTRTLLLAASLLLGLSHLNRSLFGDPELQAFRTNWQLWVGWQALFVFLCYRMAVALGFFA